MSPDSYPDLFAALDSLASRRLILVGGKGGVGKTTVASLAALHFAKQRPTILFSSDPASNLPQLFPSAAHDRLPDQLIVESLAAEQLYSAFLEQHESLFVEAGDRGTYLDRDEIERLFRLALPGVDELMSWLRIGDLVEGHAGSMVIVDTAPTGHTLRMITSTVYFEEFVTALETMQQKHRNLVTQLTRRTVRDEIDARLEALRRNIESHRDLFLDHTRTSFIPVTLAEPLVTEQTIRVITEVTNGGIQIPFIVLNQAAPDSCERCVSRSAQEENAIRTLQRPVVRLPRFCFPVGSATDLERLTESSERVPLEEQSDQERAPSSIPLALPSERRMLFFAGKGGVGKTTSAASIAIQLADRGERVVAISIDPAHSLPRLLDEIPLPDSLTAEAVNTKKEWSSFREKIGDQVEQAISGLTPSNVSLSSDEDVMRQLLDVGPPGADEIFALSRLVDLLDDSDVDRIVVDTAPTGHFLRLLELPTTAGEWVRELMRILLRYREVISTGRLGEELLKASRALSRFQSALTDGTAGVILVTRAEPVVGAETRSLQETVARRGIPADGVIVNYVTPETGCPCDLAMRRSEGRIIGDFDRATLIDRQEAPPSSLEDLRSLVPMVQTPPR